MDADVPTGNISKEWEKNFVKSTLVLPNVEHTPDS